jgi:AraC-like DNA-binding protein
MNIEEVLLEENFICIKLDNRGEKPKFIEKNIDSSYIQFHFSLKADSVLTFNNSDYRLIIEDMNYLTLYNPEKELPLNIQVGNNAAIICILISINKFHKLFSNYGEKNIPFLNSDNNNQKYYKNNDINNRMLLVLIEILKKESDSMTKKLYLKGKIYELFSLIFEKEAQVSNDQCPFIINDSQLKNIKLAKDIILNEFSDPPTLQQLAQRTKLSLRKLKTGFKEIYGQPVFKYLLDYKMTLAKDLLLEGSYNVNEVSLKLGYSTASHFIAAFKKNTGFTPKYYMENNK